MQKHASQPSAQEPVSPKDSQEHSDTMKKASGKSPDWQEVVLTRVAIGVLIAFLLILIFMLVISAISSSMQEVQWQRFVYVITIAHTITVVVIGWLFGKEVNRNAAEIAEQHARQAEQRATEATNDAMKGKALAAHIMGRVEAARATNSSAMDIDQLEKLIQRIYPDMTL